MAIKVIVDTASELMWIETVIAHGVLNCDRTMERHHKDYDLPLGPRTVTYEQSDDYVIDLPKISELLGKEKTDG